VSQQKHHNQAKIAYRVKQFLEEFSNYENAVTFISSLESWFEYRWGSEGAESPGQLVEFDRFPNLDGLTPDFAVRFARPYLLLGEYIKTFRSGEQGRKDVEQLVAYSRWEPHDCQQRVSHDVVAFVDVFSDDTASEHLEVAWAQGEDVRPKVPIVILGYSRDTERVNGEWYKCKWRKHAGNRQFSQPNICQDAAMGDLNHVFGVRTHHAIPVDKHALDVTKRNPLVNDRPPPLYTAIRVLYPALFDLMDDNERDQLLSDQRVEKAVTRDELLSAPILADVKPRPRVMQDALDFLVSPLGLAKRTVSEPPTYSITIDLKEFGRRDMKDFFSAKAARAIVRKLKSANVRRRRLAADPKQLNLFD
jgi:hypothetical protein